VRTRFNTFYSRGAGTPVNQSDNFDGTRVGLGAEIPASQNTFVRMDYSYTRYSDPVTVSPTQPTADVMSFDNTESLARLGFGYRF
jgi:opacity protein-like surface antigen